ncbi:uncharacterized protein LOC144624852 [Crassostrea virginica]
MSDNESVLLKLGKDTSSETRGGDIADTFNLFKTYLDSSLTAFKSDILEGQEADNSPAGWATVHQYETNDVAFDSEDDEKLRQAENRALRAIKDKRRFQPYKSTRSTGTSLDAPAAAGSQQQLFRKFGDSRNYWKRREPSSYDVCFHCKTAGHWRKNCPLFNSANQSNAISGASNK